MRGSRNSALDMAGVCPWGTPGPLDRPLPTEAASVFVDLTYQPTSDASNKKQTSRLGMLRKGLKRLSTNPVQSSPPVPLQYGPSARSAQPPPATPHRLNPIPPDIDNPYGIAYPARQARESTSYPLPDYTAPPPKPPSPDSPTATMSVAESRRVAGGTTRSGFTSRTNMTGFTGFTGFSSYPSLSRTIDTTVTARTGPSMLQGLSTGSAFGGEFGTVLEEQRSMGAVSRSTYAQSTSFGSTTQHVYVPTVGAAAVASASEAGECGSASGSASAGAISAGASGSAQRALAPPSRSFGRSQNDRDRDRFTIPEERTWSGGDEMEMAQHVPTFSVGAARPDALGGIRKGSTVAGVTIAALDMRLRQRVETAEPLSATSAERVAEVQKALENVKRLGMDQFVMKQFHMLSDAKVHRGSNSCRVRITSSLNGHTFVAKYFGDVAVMRREHDIRRTAAAAALPPVRHMDLKHHRLVVQSAVSISPELQALDTYLHNDPSAFSSRSAQVHLLTRLLTLLDLLHTQAHHIHGNISPHHILVDPLAHPKTFTFVDLACARSIGEENFGPWGTFELLFASPEVVAAALGLPHILRDACTAQDGNSAWNSVADDGDSEPPKAAASADVWSLGMVLFEATAANPYWPSHFALLDIVQALLGFTPLPHEANPHMLESCGELAPVIGRMLSRDASSRPTLLEIGELAGNCVMDAIIGFHSSEAAVSKFIETNRAALAAEVPLDMSQRETVLRDSLHAAHRLLCGQEVRVIFQVWQLMPGQVTHRQLCPLVTYGGAQDKASFSGRLTPISSMDMEPVFQFVDGRSYYLTFYIVNQDPTSLRKLPFTDAIEMRLGVGGEGDSLHEKPRIRESSAKSWWGEMLWNPSTFQHPLCQDVSKTSEANPGTATVALMLAVPFMTSPLRVKRTLRFNMSPAGTSLTSSSLHSSAVDLLQNPEAAKKELVRNGLSSSLRFGNSANVLVHERLDAA
eukprot:jgi/Ulvmu1/7327/UM035_0116.1